jgi:hypothetical protein
MTRRRWLILGTLLLGAEWLVRSWKASTGSVQIVNQGDYPMDEVVVTYANTRVTVGSIGAGKSANVWLTIAGKGTLGLEFKQTGNPMKGFQVPEFNPTENLASGLRLVLTVKDNRVERFMDDAPPSSSPWQNLSDGFGGLFEPADPPQ